MNEEQLSEIFDYYAALPDPRRQENLVAMLREIQDVLGCVPDGVAAQAARAVGEKPVVLTSLVRRFSTLKSAAWSHRITACSGARCGARQGTEVYRALCEVLRPGPDGVSENGRVLLCTQNCLKQCRTSPNVLADGVLHPHMTPESARELARKLLEE